MKEDALKTVEENFADWEGDTFGFGYGTGERYTLPALKTFLELCPAPGGGTYDYVKLEKALGGVATWLLINILARANIIEYGTSPRYGWLTRQGVALRNFVETKSADELYELTRRDENYPWCYRDACNCDGEKCQNPFWGK